MDLKYFGDNLAKILKERSIKRTELANFVGVETTLVSKWIYGKRGISLKNYIKVINFLGIEFEELLLNEENQLEENRV